MFFRIVTIAMFMYFKLKRKCAQENINQTVVHNTRTKKGQFIAYLYIPDRSIPMNIKLTGIQTLISFQLSFSRETARQRPSITTTRELIRFCLKLHEEKKNQVSSWLYEFLITQGRQKDNLTSEKDPLSICATNRLHMFSYGLITETM